MIVNTVAAAPIVKWAGGKRWLAPRLADLYALYRDRRLVEPFAGGLAVALALQPESALINDANDALVNLYVQVAAGLTVDSVPSVRLSNDAETYYAHRTRFNALRQDPVGRYSREAALLFWYLNRTGYNGLCRFSAAGRYNVPFGRYDVLDYTALAASWDSARPALCRWEFSGRDFGEVSLLPGDFVYADPPYDNAGHAASGSAGFVGYSGRSFGWREQERLAHWLAAHDGPVVVSNAATHRVVNLYESMGFAVEVLDAPRRIASNGDRQTAREMLAWRGL